MGKGAGKGWGISCEGDGLCLGEDEDVLNNFSSNLEVAIREEETVEDDDEEETMVEVCWVSVEDVCEYCCVDEDDSLETTLLEW
jgi:hypothetical protein